MILKRLKENLHWLVIGLALVIAWRWAENAFESNQSIMKPLSEGVISGILTSLFILVFATLWKSNISQWLQDITYRDAKVEGVWQGFLVPYMGIKEIDRARRQAAWAALVAEKIQKAESEGKVDAIDVESTPIDRSDEPVPASAELILSSKQASEENTDVRHESKPMRIEIVIGVQPIKMRAELTRVGNKIEGRLIEIGGASEVHTYVLQGSFKNLMLCGNYENENPQNIDRGSFSLMLKENGLKLEGFFASYTDKDESIYPFKCELKRNGDSNLFDWNSNSKMQKTGA
jgi:hypothetical protein